MSPCEPNRRQAHALLQATFADHFDFQPRTYEQWLDDIDNSSGALALYERHRMKLDFAVDTWEPTCPVGESGE